MKNLIKEEHNEAKIIIEDASVILEGEFTEFADIDPSGRYWLYRWDHNKKEWIKTKW